ncbi:MAG: disulfide bond formation protein B [Parachlamydiales bacterium]|nr:disulfide bond formation protein B [Parachlamydiales bacterium]
MKWIQKNALYLAWVIALVGMLGSIFYGEVLRFEPCRLCWYQRIAMFPLVLFLGIAFYKEEPKMARCCLPLIAIGAFFSFYQSVSQIFPAIQIASLCSESAPCTTAGMAPFLSFFAFLSMGLLIHKNRF